LERFHYQSDCSYVLASDDPRVHREAKKYSWITESCWLEKAESFYCVAEEVIETINSVNKWLNGLSEGKEEARSLLYWEMHCEGGDTSQRVLDILLLQRSYHDLIMRFNPLNIILITKFKLSWEDQLLLSLATDFRIPVKVLGNYFQIRSFLSKFWAGLRPLLASIYYSLKIIRIKCSNLFHRNFPINNEKCIMLQLCGREKKHLGHIIPVAESINAVGLEAVILGWRLNGSTRHLREKKIKFLELEDFVSLQNLICGWIWMVRYLIRAKVCSKSFLSTITEPTTKKICKVILIDSVFFFLIRDFINRYLMMSACKKVFSKWCPVAFCPWTLRLAPGIIAFEALPKIKPPILFIYGGWPYNFSNPIDEAYFEREIPREKVIWFVISSKHIEYALRRGFRQENLFIAGFHFINKTISYYSESSVNEIRKKLGLGLNNELYIFFDPNVVYRGYISQQEQVAVLITLLELAKRYPEIALIIKPHPAEKNKILESIVLNFELSNVKLIPSTDLPYDSLYASDLIISKYSTLLFQAMFMGLPGLSVILDNEKNFMIYENAVDYFFSLDSLREFIIKLIKDQDLRHKWKKDINERQQQYLVSQGLSAKLFYGSSIAKGLKSLVVEL